MKRTLFLWRGKWNNSTMIKLFIHIDPKNVPKERWSLPEVLPVRPPACKGWWSSSTGPWTKPWIPQHPWDTTGRAEVLRATKRTHKMLIVISIQKVFINRASLLLPMVTSEELCVSRKRLRWCQTRGIQSMIFTSSMLRVRLPISVSISFLLR